MSDALYRDDLSLAAAAVDGDSAAVDEMVRMIDGVRPAARGIVAEDRLDDVVQDLRVALLVGGDGKPPRLASYAGRGPLRSFVRVSLIRAALGARKRSQPVAADEDAWLALPALSADPGLETVRRRCAPVFKQAFEEALAQLEPKERTLLRQHFLDGLGSGELAALNGVHRVTVFRWIAEIKQRLLASLERQLVARIGIAPGELTSLARMLASGFGPSLERILASRDGG